MAYYVAKNHTNKIHASWSVGCGASRASCNQNIVMVGKVDAAGIDAADESRFCGKCFFAKFDGGRRGHARHIASLEVA